MPFEPCKRDKTRPAEEGVGEEEPCLCNTEEEVVGKAGQERGGEERG